MSYNKNIRGLYHFKYKKVKVNKYLWITNVTEKPEIVLKKYTKQKDNNLLPREEIKKLFDYDVGKTIETAIAFPYNSDYNWNFDNDSLTLTFKWYYKWENKFKTNSINLSSSDYDIKLFIQNESNNWDLVSNNMISNYKFFDNKDNLPVNTKDTIYKIEYEISQEKIKSKLGDYLRIFFSPGQKTIGGFNYNVVTKGMDMFSPWFKSTNNDHVLKKWNKINRYIRITKDLWGTKYYNTKVTEVLTFLIIHYYLRKNIYKNYKHIM